MDFMEDSLEFVTLIVPFLCAKVNRKSASHGVTSGLKKRKE